MTEFRDQNGEQVDWSEIYAVIFDVDGTLYRQFPVRVHMGFRLASHFLLHPREIRDLIGIYQFRKLREEEIFQASSLETQIHEAANRAGLPEEKRLHEVIQTWMFREPLSLIRRYANRKVLDLMDRLQDEGKQVVIWSDYAPEEKLAALDVKCPEDTEGSGSGSEAHGLSGRSHGEGRKERVGGRDPFYSDIARCQVFLFSFIVSFFGAIYIFLWGSADQRPVSLNQTERRTA